MSSQKTKTALELSVTSNGKEIARNVYQQDKIVLGRILSADFNVASPEVSRIHALIEILGDSRVKITDLASSHGTFVNGEKIVEKILDDQDQVKLAGVELKLRWIYSDASQVGASSREATHAGVVTPYQKVAEVTPRSSEVPQSMQNEVVSAHTELRDPTVVRSLKSTARTRGALDPSGRPHEELEVTVYWEETILRIDHYKAQNKTVTIGDGVHSDYIVPDKSFPKKENFLKLKGNRAQLIVHPSMKLSARVNGHMYSNKDIHNTGMKHIELSGGDIAKIQMGKVNFFLMFVPDPPPIQSGKIFDQGALFWSILCTVFLVSAVFFGASFFFQKPIEGEVREFPEKLRKIIIKNYKQKQIKKIEKKKKEVVKDKKKASETPKERIKNVKPDKSQSSSDGGAKAAGKEGKRGEKKSKNARGKTARPKNTAKTPKPEISTSVSKSVTKKTNNAAKKPSKLGLVQSFKNSSSSGRLAKLGGGMPGNESVDKAFSGIGSEAQSAAGSSARGGLKGAGAGGGGSVATGSGLGTTGFGKGEDGSGNGLFKGKGTAQVGLEGGGIGVGAGVSKEEIDRVMRSHMTEVNYCYNKYLSKNSSLSGKISVAFSVAANGVVTKSRTKQNTTGNAALANCIRNQLKRWRFPISPGGTYEVEQFPFVFKAR